MKTYKTTECRKVPDNINLERHLPSLYVREKARLGVTRHRGISGDVNTYYMSTSLMNEYVSRLRAAEAAHGKYRYLCGRYF